MIGFRPDHVGVTESEKLSSLYPDWLRIVVVPGKLLESAFCAEAYWSKYEVADGLFDAANDEYVAATGGLHTNVYAEALFSPGVQVNGLLVSWVETTGTLTMEVNVDALFGGVIVARGVLEACN